ncbi:hypothetical protein SMALB_7366 [Streptomyces malaysiensis]|uniref:Uncharacterized protein n=2 Tax=Streptomyces malaysiensis TaxID=92644 RepID=A0A7X5X9U3_STRMQ|nr:hypothetical protein [Streptomyces malaysiensis]
MVVAVTGVAGTLLAPLLAARSQARGLAADFARQQTALMVQWEREKERDDLTQRRACYIATNAAFRRYRTQLLEYLWWTRLGTADAEQRQVVEDARHDHHAALGEAQMVASPAVLDELDSVARLLSDTYRRIMLLGEGNPEPGWSFDEIENHLIWLWERWKKMRAVMRADLGVIDAASVRQDSDE